MTNETTLKQPWFATLKRYAILGYGAVGSILALGLMAAGSLLVGIAIAVLLASFGLIEIETDLTTGPLIVSWLLLAVAGGFCLGVAAESPLGRGRRLEGYKLWEVGIGRILASLAVGLAMLFVYRILTRFLGGLPEPLLKGAEVFRAVGSTAMIAMPLIGVPLSLLLRGAPTGRDWVTRLDNPAMFVVWLFAAMMTLT